MREKREARQNQNKNGLIDNNFLYNVQCVKGTKRNETRNTNNIKCSDRRKRERER